ncbi:hypothetical protein [Bradyrhizobium sp. USDA 4520]
MFDGAGGALRSIAPTASRSGRALGYKALSVLRAVCRQEVHKIMLLLCLAIALHDVDGPIRCATGERIRLAGIGATELDGSQRPGQPGIPGDPFAQRRAMAAAIGAQVASDDRRQDGYLRFAQPVRLSCDVTGRSGKRLVAWCRLPDGRDASCVAIGAGVAVRWDRFDPQHRLDQCAARGW